MKRGLVALIVLAMTLVFTNIALAADIVPREFDLNAERNGYGPKDWGEKSQGDYTGNVYTGYGTSTHIYGTWNSPYTAGVDGYNYNDSQDYTETGKQVDGIFTSGPHGGYLTSTHRCRECHAVHRAAGEFKLLRSDTRYESCDWCHGTGAGSGFNIQTDNDDIFTIEYNVGHTMGFGISTGKWKAPDDTFPAFTPNYWQGGFSCFDCHSPHANPQRMLGYNDDGEPVGLLEGDQYFGIANPGHDLLDGDTTHHSSGPIYLSGSWLLVKNPDRETAVVAEPGVSYYRVGDAGAIGSIVTIDIAAGEEISDMIFAYTEISGGTAVVTAGQLNQFDSVTTYPVNKMPIDWNDPIGSASSSTDPSIGFTTRNSDTTKRVWNVSEFCTDCHDGNAGLHTVTAPLFSEDRALRGEEPVNADGTPTNVWRGNYDLAHGHDEQSRSGCDRQMRFNPEDGYDFGPGCRNCHKGSSACGTCHEGGGTIPLATTADNNLSLTSYDTVRTSTGETNQVADYFTAGFFKQSRTVIWDDTVRTSGTDFGENGKAAVLASGGSCLDDGFSWPHRTLGWKMLKDDLFGLNFDGTEVAVGGYRSYSGTTIGPAHDIDSVCLDCHNPTIWNVSKSTLDPSDPTKNTHYDNPDPGVTSDDFDDELILRGLP